MERKKKEGEEDKSGFVIFKRLLTGKM